MPSKWVSYDVISNGIKIHYTRTGGDRPPLLLAHGFTDNGLCWRRLTQVLEDDYDVIMVDARGHGLSDAPDSGYSSADHAADLAGVIKALNLDRTAVMGHSMGAATAATLAADYPALVSCAILEDPPWRVKAEMAPPEQIAAFRETWQQMAAEQQSMSVEAIIEMGKTLNPDWQEIEWPDWAESKRQFNLNSFSSLDSPPQPWQEIVGRLSCPVLLLTADNDKGAIVTPAAAAEAATLLADGRVVKIDGAGHNIRREQFEAVLRAVTDFLSHITKQ